MNRFYDSRPVYPPEYDGPEGPSDDDMLRTLDAYGHLQWTVGNEDWIACADYNVFIRPDDDEPVIAYHVVVDCESGGFTDTIEQGVFPASKLGDLDTNRWCPLETFFDICCEHYINEPELCPDSEEAVKVYKDWTERLISDVRLALKMIENGEEIPEHCCISDDEPFKKDKEPHMIFLYDRIIIGKEEDNE